MKKSIGSYPRVRIEGGGRGVVSQAGAVLLVETVRKAGLDQVISAAPAPWQRPRAVHDPGKILLDVALAVALGGDCLADAGMLRAEPAAFGPVASDPTVSRLIDTLATAGPKAPTAIRPVVLGLDRPVPAGQLGKLGGWGLLRGEAGDRVDGLEADLLRRAMDTAPDDLGGLTDAGEEQVVDRADLQPADLGASVTSRACPVLER